MKSRPIYLDWAAGAPVHPIALEALAAALALGPGNPSSVHAGGRAARAVLERAREQVAALVGCEPRELVFTGSATEANAAAVLGAARGGSGSLVIGAVEHPSVRLAAAEAARGGARVGEALADEQGAIRADAVRAAVAAMGLAPGAGTGPSGGMAKSPAASTGGGGSGAAASPAPVDLIAVQLVNNETGVRHPVEAISLVAREAGALFHCDAVQAAGKLPLGDVWNRCDSLSLSAHKLGGLPGVGALAMRRALDLPVLIPGHQERGLRGGTPALPLIAAFGAMAAHVSAGLEARSLHLASLTSRLEGTLAAASPSVRINGVGAERVPGIVNATFPGIDGETLLVMLDLVGIALSHGAACSTGAMEPSHVLLAMGLGGEEARSTVRFSIGTETSEDDLERLGLALPQALAAARLR